MKLAATCLLLLASITFIQKTSTTQRSATPQVSSSPGVTIALVAYHGWSGSFTISNGAVEATVVPAIGRVMQFHFVREEDVFWENRSMDGQAPDPASDKWDNFGGDKSWPSPQED